MNHSAIPASSNYAVRLFGWIAVGFAAAFLAAALYLIMTRVGVSNVERVRFVLIKISLPLLGVSYATFVLWTGIALQRLRHWAPETSAIWPFFGALLLCVPVVNVIAGWFHFQSLLKSEQAPNGQNNRWRWIANLWAILLSASVVLFTISVIYMLPRMNMPTARYGLVGIVQTLGVSAIIAILVSITLGILLILKISHAPLRLTQDQQLANTFD